MVEMPSPLSLELAAALCIGLSGAPGGLWRRSGAAGQAIATALNLIGSVLGLAGLALHARAGEAESLRLGQLPIGEVAFGLDGLSALFLVPILLVSALGSLYGASYWGGAEQRASGPRLRLWWGFMTASMILVVLARDAVVFLVAWELMALAAFFLIGTEDERVEVRRASWTYLVATHAGTLCLLACFVLLLFAVHDPVAIGILLFVSSAFGFGFSTPVQIRILHGAREAPRLAATLVSTAYNIGIAAGAALGAILLSNGMDYALLPVAGIITSGLAAIVAAISLRLDHRRAGRRRGRRRPRGSRCRRWAR